MLLCDVDESALAVSRELVANSANSETFFCDVTNPVQLQNAISHGSPRSMQLS